MLRPVGDTVGYELDGAVATLTLDRPQRLNAIVPALIDDLGAALDRAEADDAVHAIRLRGAGRSFCAGYDIEWGAQAMKEAEGGAAWDPMADYRMMSRFVAAYMRLWRSPKPVIAQVHGHCVGGGTDFALCSDLIVCADDCRIGYPPARVWGVPTSMLWAQRIGLERARRLLFTGDSIDGLTAVEWGLATEAAPLADLDEAFERLLERIARLPVNQLVMHKLAINAPLLAQGLHGNQVMSVFFDGIARHTPEGYEFAREAARDGFREAVRGRDEPFGDHGLS